MLCSVRLLLGLFIITGVIVCSLASAAAGDDRSSIELTNPVRARLFVERNGRLRSEGNLEFRELAAPQFDDSRWVEFASFEEFRKSGREEKMLQPDFSEGAPLPPRMEFFPLPFISADSDVYRLVMRTRFLADSLPEGKDYFVSHTGQSDMLFFLNGEFIGPRALDSIYWRKVIPLAMQGEEDVVHLPRNLLRPGENLLTVAALASSWPPRPVTKLEAYNEQIYSWKHRLGEFFRINIGSMAVGATILIAAYFVLVGWRTRRQREHMYVAILSLCTAFCLSYTSGLYQHVPLHPLYQRKLFVLGGMLYSAVGLAAQVAAFDYSGVKHRVIEVARRLNPVLFFLSFLLPLFVSSYEFSWTLMAAPMVFLAMLPVGLSFFVFFEVPEARQRHLWILFAGYFSVFLTAIESLANFILRYSSAWSFAWSGMFLMICYAYYYNRRYRDEFRELDQLREELMEKVEEKTRHLYLSNQHLRHAMKQVKALSQLEAQKARMQELGNIAVHMGHKISNPLQVISLALEDLSAEGEISKTCQENIDRMNHAVERMRQEIAALSGFKVFADPETLDRGLGATKRKRRKKMQT